MRKSELISEVAQRTGIGKAEVQATIETMFEVVRERLCDGDTVYVRGFGSFFNKLRAKKVARNIAKNTSINVPAHYIPSFRPSQEFSDEVRSSEVLKKNLDNSK